ncbi:cellulose biosynthesis protein BcsD [Xanthomonas vesicatoria]|uniref:Cellulose synthase n=2 Tax=Xanthomonas vesicatoria TaxID=56460 RepID=A0AAJ0J0X6_9XANT|nr:hypothetical protein [Xanthomonas vesicatoria]APO96481.1 hypothetical protein BI313_19550 [Xanthomonas vesicatoria]APP76578.1 hypothetical protein BJD12_16630 [Xanthomonas vesicatoria ATCC 35937]KHM90366.1 hypothetical protein OR60_22165 [Xanthomonas vesicatoria]KHM97142.1 hypothetical protein OR61_04735 [Xanthomonas vesicatoria]KTF31213.1 hypothetical protein LMG920_16940 [Xanthomonas vesicatoria]
MPALEPLSLYRTRSCSRQWLGFVRAMAEEFGAELPEQDLATLMARIGRRFAREHRLAPCAALDEVQQAANAIWDSCDWGQCAMDEHADRVQIRHGGAPLSVALDGAAWSDGFLQGVYEGWFQQLGMLAGLAVQSVPGETVDLRLFVLARTA